MDSETKIWEPAKPGDELPEGIWIPNRRERRKMANAKNNKRGLRALGKMFEEVNDYAKHNPDYKQDIYKALYENLKKKAAEKEEEFKKEQEEKENEATIEGN